MMRLDRLGVLALLALLGACGNTTEESAATGGLGGAAIGALAGGPVGAAIGLGAGAAAGTGVEAGQKKGIIPPEPGDQAASAEHAGNRTAANGDVRRAQLALRDQGLYDGPIDGISGRRTRHAVSEFQRRQGLPQTARLDDATRDALQSEVAAVPADRRRGPAADVRR